jgi:hypothetical protein
MAKEQVLRFKPARRLEEVDDEHCERMQEHIVRDHATILPDDATPKPDGIFGKDNASGKRPRPIRVFARLKLPKTLGPKWIK